MAFALRTTEENDPLSRKGPAMATIFSVIGHHHEDPDRLLLLGDDGTHYQYDLPHDSTTPVEPDDEWDVDPNAVGQDQDALLAL